MGVRLAGTVKWFSAKKGFGFIAAKVKEDDSEEQEVFVHQTSIVGGEDGKSFRTLTPNVTVEFEVQHDAETGKPKALNVTGPGGQPIELPTRRAREQRLVKKDSSINKGNATTPKPRQKKTKKESASSETPFHTILTEDVREKIKASGIDLESKGTVDLAIGDDRVKLGLGQYAGLARKDGVIAEGRYSCDESGLVSITWSRSIKFQDGSWQPYTPEDVLTSVLLTEVKPVALDETPEKLWGADKTDPRDAFEQNGFLMRRVVLTRPPRQSKQNGDA